jgi:hypothetical protein
MTWFAFLTLLIPLAWVSVIIREIRLARRLRKVGIEVVGRIVHQRLRSSRGGTYFIPTVRFKTQLRQVITTESAGIVTRSEFHTGEDVVLYYDPDQPARFLFAPELADNKRYLFLAFGILLGPFIWWIVWK